jgi:TolA-binding protein
MPYDAEPAVSSQPASNPPLMDAPTAAERSVAERGEGGRTAEELSYDQAWEALRTNNFGRAANGFGRVVLLAPDGPLVEDASFWRAVALARGQRHAEALSALRDFLDSYGASPRAGEASAMLGWMLIDARAYDEAARRFAAAVRDASPAVRSSAQAGLDALAHRKP